MTVLSDTTIRSMGNRLVTPFNADMVQPASIDLTLGYEFIPNIDDRSGARRFTASSFTLRGRQFVLAVTQETVTIPNDMMGRLEGKSSLGRKGLMVHVTAGYIDPGWSGVLTLELFNLLDTPITVHGGQPICQLSVHELDRAAAEPYDGKYQHARGVQQSKEQ